MKFELKNYKLKRATDYYKKTPLFFIFSISSINSKSWLRIEQDFYTQNLKYFKVYNTLLSKVIEKSIFKKMSLIINSFTCFVHPKNDNIELVLKKLTTLNPLISFLGLRLNNNVYSVSQLSNVYTLDYFKNIRMLNKLMKKVLKFPYYKLSK